MRVRVVREAQAMRSERLVSDAKQQLLDRLDEIEMGHLNWAIKFNRRWFFGEMLLAGVSLWTALFLALTGRPLTLVFGVLGVIQVITFLRHYRKWRDAKLKMVILRIQAVGDPT